jgi:hypothetical protein
MHDGCGTVTSMQAAGSTSVQTQPSLWECLRQVLTPRSSYALRAPADFNQGRAGRRATQRAATPSAGPGVWRLWT